MANIFKAKTLVGKSGIFSQEVIAPNLVYNTGNQTISGIKTFVSRPTVNGTGVLLSGEAASLPITIVYTTGNQTISGNKSFVNNLEVQGTGIFNALDLSNISQFDFSGTNISLINGNVNISGGTLYISGNPVLTILPTTIVYTTGNQTISGTKTFSANTYFQNDIIVTGNARISGASYFNDNVYITGNLSVGGNINNPTLVLTKNKQTISGDKTFADIVSLNAYIGNGYDSSNLDYRLNIGGNIDENVGIQIDSYGINPPQILMRRARGIPTGLSGVLKDDVLFNLQARGYVSGLNAYSQNSRAAVRLLAAEDWVARAGYTGQGTYILFRTTNTGSGLAMDKVIIGTSGLNVLDGNIYVSGNQVLTGIDLSPYATNTNLIATGNTLNQKIDNLSGTSVLVYGNQIISGNKTFINNINISGTGIFNALDLNNIDVLSISGVDININNGNIISNGTINGTNLVYNTGSQDVSGIKNFSNRPTVNGTGILLSGEVANLPSTIVYTTGNQTISGYKTFNDASGINLTNGTYRINNIPYNTFTINFLSSNANLSTGHNYISNVGAGYQSSATDRLIPVMDNCTARKASISLLNAGAGNNVVGITGYFINTSSIPPQTGIINASISATVGSTQFSYTGTFATPINISVGDNVTCSLFSNNTATNVRTSATIYCYN